jgi:hypothetical protein
MNISKIIALGLVILVIILLFSFYFIEEKEYVNKRPTVEILYPKNNTFVSKIVTVTGIAADSDGSEESLKVEIRCNGDWVLANGNLQWSYELKTFDFEEGSYKIQVRAYDGIDYSDIKEIDIIIDNPEVVESSTHRWAIFIAAANFPQDNDSKLGNGALNLAEEMSTYFIEDLGYSTSNIIILFDDGWIREDNGLGKPIMPLEQRIYKYDITYGGATKDTVTSSINYIVNEANKYDNSEIFIWIASHGYGDMDKKLGGKILQRSAIFLWDFATINDKELSNLLSGLRSKKTCIIVDACYSGGFADKTILSFSEFLLLRANLAKAGRVVITGASKFRVGYASTVSGPLFTQLWFIGLKTGAADGFRPGLLDIGRPTRLKIFRDGKVSVEEAFYFARYVLRTESSLKDYNKMEPQINDKYPRGGPLGSMKGLVLGE